MLLKNAKVMDHTFTPVEADLLTEGELIGRIGAPGSLTGEEEMDLTGCLLVPGFIDQHIHGCAGHDVSDASPEGLQAVSAELARNGVTSFCPTTMTLPEQDLAHILLNVQQGMQQGLPGAYALGVNMEGPFFSIEKKGAQNPAYVRNPDVEEFERLYRGSGEIIRLVDIAPECEGGMEFIRRVSPYCAVSLAHSSANYNEATRAFSAGITQVTHMFNAMTGLNHRDPGAVGAVLDSGTVRAEFICDGFHIHPAVLRIAFRALGEDRTIVVSDSMKAAGYQDGEYDLGGQTVYVKNGKALLADGTIAASTTNLHQELKNLLRFGIPLRQVIKSLTINPARQLGVDAKTGSIREGKRADLVALDSHMEIRMVMVKGRLYRTQGDEFPAVIRNQI
jgi:N-acetylglucosamine-6-phosphate deacetylase